MAITRVEEIGETWSSLRTLLNLCYPRPPQNVCDLLETLYRDGFPAWLAEEEGQLVGFVCLIPNSKGGTLETLAVSPFCQRRGVGKELVDALLKETPGIVSLTTRIPLYFDKFGFWEVDRLVDGSIFMLRKC